MQLAELMKVLADGSNTPHYMIWYGEEQKILDLYIDRLCQFYKPVKCVSVQSALNQISVKSLDKSAKVYIVNEDEEYKKNEDAWESVCAKFNKSKHILLLRYSEINKKNTFYGRQKDYFVEFVHLQEEVLLGYVYKELPQITEENAIRLCAMCGNDYGRILLESDKINQYAKAHGLEVNASFNTLVSQGVIFGEVGDITFELTNAVLGGYCDLAIKKLDEALRKGEPSLRIASILYNGFRNLLSYEGLGKDKRDATKKTGLLGWQIKQCIELAGGYNVNELMANMILCQSVESGIKSGTIDEDNALEYMVLHCLK